MSILLDSDWAKDLTPLWERLRAVAGPGPLWDFDYGEYLHTFRRAARLIGAPDLVPYQTRHSGPSVDRARGSRSLLEVQKRGQWKSGKSVARYEKHARLADSFHQHGAALQAYFQECELRGTEIVLHARLVPLPRSGAT